jgi:hypothetical protein
MYQAKIYTQDKLEEFRTKWDNKYRYVGESWEHIGNETAYFIQQTQYLSMRTEALLKCLYLWCSKVHNYNQLLILSDKN